MHKIKQGISLLGSLINACYVIPETFPNGGSASAILLWKKIKQINNTQMTKSLKNKQIN